MADQPNNNNNNNNNPIVVQYDQAQTVANHVEPTRDFQTEFSSYEGMDPVNYHSHVNNDGSREDKFIWLLLLNVGLPNGSDNYRPYKLERSTKKPRLHEQTPRKYRRLYTFANLISNGGTCFFFENGSDDQMKSLRYLEKCRIGNQFVAVEPSRDAKFIGNEMPIVTTNHQLIPSHLTKPHLIPEVPVPPQVDKLNSSKFFVLHNATLTMDGTHLVQTNCTQGNMCDLRKPDSRDCACWYQRNRNRYGAEYTIRCDLNVEYIVRNSNMRYQQPDELPTVEKWSSQRFTDFVFDGTLPLDPLQRETDRQITKFIRRKLTKLVDFVNTTDSVPRECRGWTVIGWYRRAAKMDAATGMTADDRVAAEMEEITMHIVRVEPTGIAREQLAAANLLLPVNILGETANLQHIRRANEEAANQNN